MKHKKLFINYCKTEELEINDNQITTIEAVNKFYQNNFDYNFFSNLFSKKEKIRILFTRRCWSRKNHDFEFFLQKF